MEDKIDLGNGFSYEVIETVPDNNGCSLEGFLYYLNDILVGYKSKRLYKSEKSLCKHMKNVVLPEYINDHGGAVYSIRYFLEDNVVYEFVKEFLLNNKITWGSTLDIIEVLESAGYYLPKHGEKGFTVDELNLYISVVNQVSLEMLKHLKSFGFGADRNMSVTKDHVVKEKYGKGCSNIIYTRYPWTAGYKMIKTVMSFLSISSHNFLAGQDTSEFKTKDPEAYEFLDALTEYLKDVNVEANNVVSETGFRAAAIDFVSYMDDNSSELCAKYKLKSPVNYGVYE